MQSQMGVKEKKRQRETDRQTGIKTDRERQTVIKKERESQIHRDRPTDKKTDRERGR